MNDRYLNREKYFQEQNFTTENYVIPFISDSVNIAPGLSIAEIGCGEGGNLKPFLELGCRAVGIDLAENKIANAEKFYSAYPYRGNLTLIADDVYNIDPGVMDPFDIIMIRDTLEHIHDQQRFLRHLKKFIKPSGKIFLAFPPWHMPFGGHQQMCQSTFLNKLPYFHLLPKLLYKGLLKLFGEKESKIKDLLEIKETGISVRSFKKITKEEKFIIEKENFYLINPNYKVKFNLNPKLLPKFLNIPFIRDFFTTTYYCLISKAGGVRYEA